VVFRVETAVYEGRDDRFVIVLRYDAKVLIALIDVDPMPDPPVGCTSLYAGSLIARSSQASWMYGRRFITSFLK
jgi:hypothetical protein